MDDGLPGRAPDLAVLRRRLERRDPCRVRPAARVGAPPPLRGGRARRGGDARRRAPRLRRADHRALGLRRAARAATGTGVRARSRRTSTSPPTSTRPANGTRGLPSRWRSTTSGRRSATRSAGPPGRWMRRCMTAGGRRQHQDTIDGHLVDLVRGAGRGRDRRPALERWGTGGEGAAATRAGEPGPAAVPPASSKPSSARSPEPPGTAPCRSVSLGAPTASTVAPRRLLGEHTDEVLRAVGVTDDELAELRELGVVGDVPDAAR